MMTSVPLWRTPPETLMLGSHEVQVWRIPLDLDASHLENLWQSLSAEEQARAGRFRFGRDRDHFIAANGALRAILGRYLNRDPGQLLFCRNSHGKPALARGMGDGSLRFNLSHSGSLALVGLTRDREIGVDLEQIRSRVANEQIAERFFSPREVAMLRALPLPVRQEAFFKCWTRKEAIIKAIGTGMSLRLDKFDVSFSPGEPVKALRIPGQSKGQSRWSIQELKPAPGFSADLAIQGGGEVESVVTNGQISLPNV